jgi:poly-gamma-glutamate synthesis protein (capsule biosynthesis protein)
MDYLLHLLSTALLAAVGTLSLGSLYIAPAPAFSTPEVRVIFGGDLMFDRTIRTIIDKKGGDFLFSCIDPLLQSADIVVANLEGPITTNPSKSTQTRPGHIDNMTFTFATSTAPLLLRHNIRIVNLGNNHIYNFGASGVTSTIDVLRTAGVGYFGDPLQASMLSGEINHVHIAYINYNQFIGADSASTTFAQIRDARDQGYLPIVYTHWGVEYTAVAPLWIKRLAHQFVDAGASMVIGSHPHVVEDHEMYRGKYIYYSLGNFVFDQYWNDAVSHGLLLEATISQTGVVGVKEIPIELGRDGRMCAM